MSNGFDSHDGFTRAFTRQFCITPQKYQTEKPPVNWYVHYPVEAYYVMKEGFTPMSNEKVSRTVTVTVVERPARKLIFLRHNATDYFSACEEVGCEWEGFVYFCIRFADTYKPIVSAPYGIIISTPYIPIK